MKIALGSKVLCLRAAIESANKKEKIQGCVLVKPLGEDQVFLSFEVFAIIFVASEIIKISSQQRLDLKVRERVCPHRNKFKRIATPHTLRPDIHISTYSHIRKNEVHERIRSSRFKAGGDCDMYECLLLTYSTRKMRGERSKKKARPIVWLKMPALQELKAGHSHFNGIRLDDDDAVVVLCVFRNLKFIQCSVIVAVLASG